MGITSARPDELTEIQTRRRDDFLRVAAAVFADRGYQGAGMREIAERFPEACAVEAHVVEQLLGVPLVRGQHRLDGCGRCEYSVVTAAVASTDILAWQQEKA